MHKQAGRQAGRQATRISTAAAADGEGWTALETGRLPIVHALLAALPTLPALQGLAGPFHCRPEHHSVALQGAYRDLVSDRLPLTGDEWALAPCPCVGLGRALPWPWRSRPSRPLSCMVRRLPQADADLLQRAVHAVLRRLCSCAAAHLRQLTHPQPCLDLLPGCSLASSPSSG